jgi:hypothetical protein
MMITPDGGHHSVDDGGGKQVPEDARPHRREGELQAASDDDRRQRSAIPDEAATELLHGRERDHDEPRGGALDGQRRASDERRDEPADDRRRDAGDRGKPARHRDSERQRQRDQEHQEARDDVGAPVALQAFEAVRGRHRKRWALGSNAVRVRRRHGEAR